MCRPDGATKISPLQGFVINDFYCYNQNVAPMSLPECRPDGPYKIFHLRRY